MKLSKSIISLLLCFIILGLMGCTNKNSIKENSTYKSNLNLESLEGIYLYTNGELSLDDDNINFTPQLLLTDKDFRFDLTSNEYLEGTYELNNDGLMILKIKFNHSNLKDTIVKTISFTKKDKSLILNKELKNYLDKNSEFK